MPTGSCLCGAIKLEYTGEPTFKAICYCDDDTKIDGNHLCFQIPGAQFKVVQGEPRVYERMSDFGRKIKLYFCPNCGTALYRTGGAPNVQGLVGLRAHVLDDTELLRNTKPGIEVFVEKRPAWRTKFDGAIQLNRSYEGADDESRRAMEKIMKNREGGES